MSRIPFGISQLDLIFNGGAPSGSVVLVAGEAGAGAREFLYTCAVMNALHSVDDELFDLHYGPIPRAAAVPPEVHFISFTASEMEFERELAQVIDEAIVEPSLDAISFQDFSSRYFQPSPVPRSWYIGESQRITDLGSREDRRGTLEALGDYLDTNAEGNLVVIDSLTDLAAVMGDGLQWREIALVVKGLRRASRYWDGLILLFVDKEAMTGTQFGLLMGSADGTLVFEWAAGGNALDRTMVVKEFRGVLPEIEEDDIVRFETEITEAGFDISDVRKIR